MGAGAAATALAAFLVFRSPRSDWEDDDINLGRDPDESIPAAVGMSGEEIYEMFRLLAIAKYNERYVIPPAHAEQARPDDPQQGRRGRHGAGAEDRDPEPEDPQPSDRADDQAGAQQPEAARAAAHRGGGQAGADRPASQRRHERRDGHDGEGHQRVEGELGVDGEAAGQRRGVPGDPPRRDGAGIVSSARATACCCSTASRRRCASRARG